MSDIVIYDGYGDGIVDGEAWDAPVGEWDHFDPCQAASGQAAHSVVDDGADYNRFEGVVGIMYGGVLLCMGAFGVAVVVVLIGLLFGGV